MAVCEIWDVKGRQLEHPIEYIENPEKTLNPRYSEADLQALGDVMNYATNDVKTEKQFFVSGVNCDLATARDEMIITKKQYQDESKIICYHAYQSFKPGELTPELAHEVGVKLAEKMWGERFQVVVATHLNTDCLHNHFVINSISFMDGKHYHDNKANLRLLRKRSDELCREHQLSVIENPSGKKKKYSLYQAEKAGLPTRDSVAREAVDEAIRKSYTIKDFERQLKIMGYQINYNPNRKYWTIQGKGWKRPKRLHRLGDDYTNERIVERIKKNSYQVKERPFAKEKKPLTVYRVTGSLKKAKRIGGLRGLYFHYCYKLGIFPRGKKQSPAKLHYLLRDDLLKLDVITKETKLLTRYRIETKEQLFSLQSDLEGEKEKLLTRRKKLYSKIRRAKTDEEKSEIRSELSEIAERMKTIGKEVRLIQGIAVRSDELKDKMKRIRTDEQAEQGKEKHQDEHRRRSGGTNR